MRYIKKLISRTKRGLLPLYIFLEKLLMSVDRKIIAILKYRTKYSPPKINNTEIYFDLAVIGELHEIDRQAFESFENATNTPYLLRIHFKLKNVFKRVIYSLTRRVAKVLS